MCCRHHPDMDDLATNLRAAAQKLSLSDAEIARRLGISQQRFTHYANGTRRPDYGTLVRICRLLATDPNELLGFMPQIIDESAAGVLRRRIAAAAAAMDEVALKRAAAVLDALLLNEHPSETPDK